MSFARTDRSAVAQWWWTVDRWTMAAIAALIAFGSLMVMAASPAVVERLNAAGKVQMDAYYFVRHYFVVLPVAMAILFFISLQGPRTIRRIAVAGLVVALVLLAYTFIGGTEIKGARRWISLPLLSIQPSEFVKPTFAVVAAWLLAKYRLEPRFPGQWIAIALFLAIIALLVKQPDLGMAAVIAAVFFAQLFLAGLRLAWAAAAMSLGAAGLVGAYFAFPHVASRIDRFLYAGGDTYQIDRSREAFMNGGLWGRGPGEGTVKQLLPDAHADFVFAVAGEELGLVVCLLIVALFGFIVLRGFSRLLQEGSLFVVLAATGLFAQFGLQAIINMASSLELIPTKGMTLPFIS